MSNNTFSVVVKAGIAVRACQHSIQHGSIDELIKQQSRHDEVVYKTNATRKHYFTSVAITKKMHIEIVDLGTDPICLEFTNGNSFYYIETMSCLSVYE